ncbi:uncharacterized protein GGS22DRAFT_154451 [Annulohypoxylon maeteangense]|uniref:uncharacterized protein n=1 Tax=Annulohypoxylon maeteangense TaxID=1927788 RepID=UPI002007A098|nr:uncharacterized protein GGS22DRAFT_154451 [Annulohypoxylon maeteangense]KAI0887845.1 hypothetical protein GGS22DRAFT_154451 [Annulohypoxylon maeteangense]
MASGLFLNPLTLLRVAPLITSTASLTIASDSHLFLSSLVSLKRERSTVNQVAPRYFETFFWRGLPEILVTFGLSLAFGIANSYGGRRPRAAAWAWYAGGSAFSLAHFAFVPTIAFKVRDAIEAKEAPDGGAAEAIQGWLNVHHVRMALADIPAWTCFLVAVVKSLRPI